MDYLTEVSRIIQAALKADRKLVQSYAKQLANKLDKAGDEKSASRITKVLSLQTGSLGSQHVSSPTVPVDGESRFPLADESLPTTEPEAVFLEKRVLERVEEFIEYVKCADELLAADIGIAPTMLLYGPPGTGKSMTAGLIASTLHLPLLTARMDTLISSFLGSTSKNLRNLFEHAARRPCVLFLDEIDALGKLRDDQHEMGELKRVVISLLQNMDRVSGETIVVAATNHPHVMDTAIWRRFQFQVEVKLPDYPARLALVKHSLAGSEPPLKLEKLAELTEAMTCSAIAEAVTDSIRNKIINRRDELDEGYLVRRIIESRTSQMMPSDLPSAEQLRDVQQLCPKVLTVRRLANVFGVSPATVTRQLKTSLEENRCG